MLPSFEEVFQLLEAAPDIAALLVVWQRVIEALGFVSFDYATGVLLTPNPSSALDFQFEHYFATHDWTAQYFDRNYVSVHRSVPTTLKRLTPYTYRTIFEKAPENAMQREMIAEVQGAGISSGLAIPLHGLDFSAGIMHLGSGLSPIEFDQLDRETRPLAALLATMFHERAQALLKPPADAPPRLSPRERECLLWVARGKTSWEIAAILSVSEATANNMIAAARRKLGVATRAQAAAKAVALGVIKP